MAKNPRRAPQNSARSGVILITMCIGLLLVQLDVTVVNVALPTVGEDLGTPASGLQWMVDGYAVPWPEALSGTVTATAAWPCGALPSSRPDPRPAVSLPQPGVLTAARAVQGVGAASAWHPAVAPGERTAHWEPAATG